MSLAALKQSFEIYDTMWLLCKNPIVSESFLMQMRKLFKCLKWESKCLWFTRLNWEICSHLFVFPIDGNKYVFNVWILILKSFPKVSFFRNEPRQFRQFFNYVNCIYELMFWTYFYQCLWLLLAEFVLISLVWMSVSWRCMFEVRLLWCLFSF